MLTSETTGKTGGIAQGGNAAAGTQQQDKPYGMSGPGEAPTNFEQLL